MNGINWLPNTSNPYMPQLQMPTVLAPQMQVIRVNGEPGVDAFQIGPNSSALLLDETAPLVWLVQTDGAGYKTKTPFDISPHKQEPPAEIKVMDDRFASIDRRLKTLEEALLDESDT